MTGAIEWLATTCEDGVERFRVGRRGNELVAEWIGKATLVTSRDGARHELTFVDGASVAERRKLVEGGARLLLRQLAGEIGLHGSAIAYEGRAIAFLGASGRGKSTIAAAASLRGAALLADDAVALTVDDDASLVEPTESAHWLDGASCAALTLAPRPDEGFKTPVAAIGRETASVPLVALVDLVWAAEGAARIEHVTGTHAFAHLLPHVVRLQLDVREHQRRELEQLERLLARVPLFVLHRPMGFEHLPSTVDIVRELCLKTSDVARRSP